MNDDPLIAALREVFYDDLLADSGYWEIVPDEVWPLKAAAVRAVLGERPAHVDPARLQVAMKAAHGRRISATETYAEAIARKYNARIDAETPK